MTATSLHTLRTLELDRNQVLVLDNRPGARVQVLYGGLWLTEEGGLDDRFAYAGDELHLLRQGRAVLQALGPTRMLIAEPLRRRWQTLQGRLMAGWRVPRPWPAVRAAPGALALTLAILVSFGLAETVAHGFLAAGGIA